MSSEEKVIEVAELPVDVDSGVTYLIKQYNPNTYTHGMFKYPCKFIPEIPRWCISKYLKGKKGNVFDPFSGSGTTLLEANVNGFNAYGTEIDDVAKLIIKVKTTTFTLDELKGIDVEFENILEKIDYSGTFVYRPGIANLEHWFSEDAIYKLGVMKQCIDKIDNDNIRDFFKLCMVSIIKKVSNADDASPKPYVSKKVLKKPNGVEKEFTNIVNRYKKMICELMSINKMGTTYIIDGDALNFVVPGGIDLAITSPPYINAFDYGRTLRLENLWIGTLSEEDLRRKKSKYVGTEKIDVKREKEELNILRKSRLLQDCYNKIFDKDAKRALIVKKFFSDMDVNLQTVYGQLNSGGKYVIVIGNSNIKQVKVESWKILEEIAHNIGFKTMEWFNYVIQNPYIRIPRNGLGGEIIRDFVLVLSKGD